MRHVNPWRTRLVRSLAAVAVVASSLAWPSAAAAGPPVLRADGQLTFGVQTATETKPDTRPYYSYSATSGASVTDYLAVFNYGSTPLTLKVYASDAFNTGTGGFDLLAANAQPTDIGSWITMSAGEVTVPAKGNS